MDYCIKTKRITYLNELHTLAVIAEEMEENSTQFHDRLSTSVHNLLDYENIFLYAEYMDECAVRTPKCLRELISRFYNHPDVREILDGRTKNQRNE
jgi:hypothetical protein